MGRRPRGLLGRRRRVELVPARPRPLAGIPLERGRDGGDDRRLQPPVARIVAVERPGPDPQGADVRAGRPRRQPRRGRQGVLVVPRRRPQQRLVALAIPLPTGSLPVRGPGRDQPRAVQARTRIRADRHRHLRRRPLLDRRGPLRQGERDRHPDADHRTQPRPGGRHAARPADAMVPQRVVVEPEPAKPELRAGPDGRSILASHPELGDYVLDIGPGPDGTQPTLLFCENETNWPGSTAFRRPRRTRRTGSTTT